VTIRMTVSDAIVQRIKSLIDEGNPLSVSVKKQFGYTFDEQQPLRDGSPPLRMLWSWSFKTR
jgi:hypothetical protein